MADLFVQAGLRVREAADAAAALSLLEAEEANVLVVSTKLHGGMHGFDLARRVAERWPRIGLILVSGSKRPPDSALPPGALFVRRPYRPAALFLLACTLAARQRTSLGSADSLLWDSVLAATQQVADETWTLTAQPSATQH